MIMLSLDTSHESVALRFIERVLEETPYNLNVLYVRGLVKYNLGDVEGCRADLKKVLVFTDNAVVRDKLSVAGKAEGEYISVTRNFAEGDTLVYRTEYKTQIEYSDAEDVFTLRYGPYQMVCTDAGVSEIAGNVESGWMANPVIYRENGNYYLQLDGEKRLNLQKYGLITHQQYNTFFVRVDG